MGLRASIPDRPLADWLLRAAAHARGISPEAYAQTLAAEAASPSSPQIAQVPYKALLMLEAAGNLDFSIVDVVRELVDLLDAGAVE